MHSPPELIAETPQHATMQDIYAAVAHFLFSWSTFEQGLTREIDAARKVLNLPCSPVRGGLSDRLALWRELAAELRHCSGKEAIMDKVIAQALKLRAIRNVIVHGLNGWNCCPENGDPPYILCARGGHEDPGIGHLRLTFAELDKCIEATAACSNALWYLDGFQGKLSLPWTFMTGIDVNAA